MFGGFENTLVIGDVVFIQQPANSAALVEYQHSDSELHCEPCTWHCFRSHAETTMASPESKIH